MLHDEFDRGCLDDRGKGECRGPVEPRSLDGLKWFPRCEHHWDLRLDEAERVNRTYPDSPCPPDWFDPAAAGERWDDEY